MDLQKNQNLQKRVLDPALISEHELRVNKEKISDPTFLNLL